MLTSVSVQIIIHNNGGSKLLSRGTTLSFSEVIENQLEEGGTDIGVYTQTRYGCYANSEYFLRGYATNIAGTVYSNTILQKTLPNEPLAPILSITDNNSVKIDINGNDGNNDGNHNMNYVVFESVTGSYLYNHELTGIGSDYSSLSMFNSGYGLLTGLTGNTQYIFSVIGLGWDGDETINGPSTSIYTWANTPTTPVVNGTTLNTLNIAIGSGDNNSNITKYLIFDESTGYCVQPDGTLNSLPNWLTKSEWGTKTVIRLNSGTQYTFKVKAKNEDGIETVYGSSQARSTLSITPTPTSTPTPTP